MNAFLAIFDNKITGFSAVTVNVEDVCKDIIVIFGCAKDGISAGICDTKVFIIYKDDIHVAGDVNLMGIISTIGAGVPGGVGLVVGIIAAATERGLRAVDGIYLDAIGRGLLLTVGIDVWHVRLIQFVGDGDGDTDVVTLNL